MITVAMVFFAFTTLLGNCFYCDNLLIYIHKKTAGKSFYERLQTGIGTCNLSGRWNGDVSFMGSFRCTDGVMALINIPVILILSEIAFKAVQDYEAQLKKGINPVLKAQTSGLVKKQISGDRFNKS